MQTLTVELEDRSYPISIGAGLLRQQSLVQAAVPATDILLVSNTTVAPLYAKSVARRSRTGGSSRSSCRTANNTSRWPPPDAYSTC